jgi:hypothetical protein
MRLKFLGNSDFGDWRIHKIREATCKAKEKARIHTN